MTEPCHCTKADALCEAFKGLQKGDGEVAAVGKSFARVAACLRPPIVVCSQVKVGN